jgi:uncharacterized membrane-anchored protein
MFAFAGAAVRAQTGLSDTVRDPDVVSAAFGRALRQSIGGPARAEILDQAMMRVPDGMVYIPHDPAVALLQVMQSPVPADFAGLLLGSEGMEAPGIVRFVPAGFIDSNEALAWTADDFLASLRDTVEAGNAERAKQGFAPQEARRWSVPPHYNPEAHTIAWGPVILRKEEPPETDGETILHGIGFGRGGYIEIQITTDERKAADIGRTINDFLFGLSFHPGKSYDDAQPGDRRAASGLAGAMAINRLQKVTVPVNTDHYIPIAGGIVAAIGAISGIVAMTRHLRREARRG